MGVQEGLARVVEVSARDVVAAEAPSRREARELCHVREAFGRSVALVLGVNAYGAGIPRLKTAVPDAEAVGAALEIQHGYTTLRLCDAEVTGARVRALFEHEMAARIGGALGERDRLLVYFAGHGLSLPSARGPEGYLLLADADPGDPGSWFAMSELRRWVGALRCRHVLIVLDCCFAGTFRWAGRRRREVSAPAYRETLERFVAHRAWQVLVSASHDQPALDAAPLARAGAGTALAALGGSRIETAQHSPFAAAFLRGLRGEADYTRDGLIVAAELELFVRDAVERATHVQQSPQLYKLDEHDRGEFVFQVPGAVLALPAAPALSPDACPFPGLSPFAAADRAAFFGRGHAAAALFDEVTAQPVTVVLGPAGVGKSSLLAAGLVPALRDAGWTVREVRIPAVSDAATEVASRAPAGAGGELGPGALFARITAWASAHPAGPLCLVLDQAERLESLAGEARDRVHGEVADLLAAHAGRLHVVACVRCELDPASRAAALEPFGAVRGFAVPPLAQHELRKVIERPARALELAFDPPGLVDTLINDALHASGGPALLSLALRELYLRCVERNRDRLLTEADYVRMGGLSGPVCRRATELLRALVAQDGGYRDTARHVFLRMTAHRDGRWLRRRVHRDELISHDAAENRRVARLLAAFRDAGLVACDRQAWQLVHDEIVRDWPSFAVWRARFGAHALDLMSELAESASRWSEGRRTGALWPRGERLSAAIRAARASGSWLNRRERAFIAASVRRCRRHVATALVLIVLAIVAAILVWKLPFYVHIAYDRDGVQHGSELACPPLDRARPGPGSRSWASSGAPW